MQKQTTSAHEQRRRALLRIALDDEAERQRLLQAGESLRDRAAATRHEENELLANAPKPSGQSVPAGSTASEMTGPQTMGRTIAKPRKWLTMQNGLIVFALLWVNQWIGLLPRLPIPGFVYATGHGKKYHSPYCRFIWGRPVHLVGENEAQGEGLQPCSACVFWEVGRGESWLSGGSGEDGEPSCPPDVDSCADAGFAPRSDTRNR